MTTDNRTNEPNKYAGFVARQNHQRDPWRGIGKKCLCGVVFDSDVDHAMHQVDEILRAALVAAQGAAPIGNSPRGRIIAEARRLGQRDWCLSVPEVAKAALNACAEALEDEGAPVQVDEAKLAELIAKASMKYNLSDRSGESHACGAPDYRSAYIAHDVAEWLRGGAQ